MNDQIRAALLEGRVILFLGAGASLGAKNLVGIDPPLGTDLAKTLAEKAGWNYAGEPLATVYSAAREALGTPALEAFLASLYRNVKPSPAQRTIAAFPWLRVYTTNIDDGLETAFGSNSSQQVVVRNRTDRIEDKDQLLGRLDYVHLNGSIRRPDAGFVFSAEEYGKASATSPRWYEEVASDFLQTPFIFIGTSLAEPVLFHHIERYKERVGSSAPKSYVLLPAATPIQVASFASYNLEYIPASFSDFAKWLEQTFPEPPKPIDIAKNRIPELRVLLEKKPGQEQAAYAKLLQSVTLVDRQQLAATFAAHPGGTIRAFFRGFKPSWRDLIDDVPAKLTKYDEALRALEAFAKAGQRLIALVGPAGSGKSTLLKWLALALSDKRERVYFIDEIPENIEIVVKELELANAGKFYIFFERLDPLRYSLARAVDGSTRAVLVGAESKNVWHNRLLANTPATKTSSISVEEIAEEDVEPLLEKIRLFGQWTRLSNLRPADRKKELFERSKRQLLIGLMETTTGVGFEEIIFRDFRSIGTPRDQLFFSMVCIATMHRANLSLSVAGRAISHFEISEPPSVIANRLQGLTELRRDHLIARHPVYARKIIESVVDREILFDATTALLSSFTVYPHPVARSLEANDATLFKSLFNHRFLNQIFRGVEADILGFYGQFEKSFENDGLFWLQYGLAMRSFNHQIKAYDILQTAYNAYPHEHTIHALAQQKLLLAWERLVPESSARSHVGDAIALLTGLDKTLESDDTYPIVTLAEGHVKAIRELDGISVARIKANEYVGLIERRLARGQNPRLQEARDRLFGFAATGTWREES
ncbi:MAG TPA: SIR2 family protein [Burkholderiaceae bacterium]|nr:SIR2 family protein [Burkholderiaceae bacterium]